MDMRPPAGCRPAVDGCATAPIGVRDLLQMFEPPDFGV